MKIFLDTNVLIKYIYFNDRTISDILEYSTLNWNDTVICTDEYCLIELVNVLHKKRCRVRKEWEHAVKCIDMLLDFNNVKIIVNSQKTVYKYKTRDPKDDRILSSAVDNKADVLLTEDKDLLEYKSSPITIITPANLVNRLWK
ncbi:MAG: putative toxin-antitoxin system toxin component, PIN family [Mycoplasmataceae bacterium]|nr:putative toxin-antitoxin system toxin component, PIN family [Mycoplasmataceae bacterium]